MANLFHSQEWYSGLCSRVDNALSVVILASEHLRLLDELDEDPVALGGLAHVLDDVCDELAEIRDTLNPNAGGE